jgi:hypothetical protein
MLDHFHVENRIEGRTFHRQGFGRDGAVVERQSRSLCVSSAGLNVFGRSIGPEHREAHPGHGLGKEASPTAYVEQREALEGLQASRVSGEVIEGQGTDELQPDRIEAMERPELPVGVPPFGCKT